MNRDIDTRGLAVLVGLSIGTVILVAAALAEATDEDLSSWVASIATVAAFAAAVVAAWYASKVYGVETDREQRVEDQDRRAQASRVAAWATQNYFVTSDGLTRRSLKALVTAHFRNASDLPVTEVRLDFLMTQLVGWGEREAAAPVSVGFVQHSVLPPASEALRTEIDLPEFTMKLDELLSQVKNPRVQILIDARFRDAAGICWRRDWRGGLEEVDSLDY